jgi:ketosteroid isomerase-like protein
MTVEATLKTMRSYLDAFLARGDFADYYTDDVTWTTVGADQELQGRQPVRDFLTGCILSLRRPPQGQDPGRWRRPGGPGGGFRRHPQR